MSDDQVTYNLYLLSEGKPKENLGIYYLSGQQQDPPPGQPVRLDADLVPWTATPQLTSGGPIQLGVGPYPFTSGYDGEVYATTRPEPGSLGWYLLPCNCGENTFTIAVDPKYKKVWTAESPGAPIKIKDFVKGGANQTFKFVQNANE